MGPMIIHENHPLHLDISPVGLHSMRDQESTGEVKKSVTELAELYRSAVPLRDDGKSTVKNGGHSRERFAQHCTVSCLRCARRLDRSNEDSGKRAKF
jgi:hypothetical protein